METAEAALQARQHDPRAAITIAGRVLANARVDGDCAEQSTAERAIGLALRELNDFDGAIRHLRRSVRIAETGQASRAAALGRMSLAYVLSNVGRNAQALHAIDDALTRLCGEDADSARMQRGLILHYLCRYEEAVRDYNLAIESVQRSGDRLVEARTLNNRGVLRVISGQLPAARDDFDRAIALFRELGIELAVADVRWNIGFAMTHRGDVPEALRVFEETEAEYRRLEVPRPALLLDRLELLMSVPLVEEARDLADRAVHELRERGMHSDLAEALLGRGRVALLAEDPDTASSSAVEAAKLFRRQRRGVWASLARQVELRAAYLRGERSRSLLTAMEKVADALDSVGWRMPALTARVDAALIAKDLGQGAHARRLLAVASRSRRGGTAVARVQGWYAEALLRQLDDDVRGATSALRRGLALLDDYRLSLGATELRALAGTRGKALALTGLDIAITSGQPAQVLAWAEYWRAGALRMTPVRPPEDPRLAAALTELRAVTTDLADVLLTGRQPGSLRRRQTQLEHEVRELTRAVSGGGAIHRPPTVRQLGEQLGDAALVEFIAHDERLLAVLVCDNRAALHDLGAIASVLRGIKLLRFALHRLVTLPEGAASRSAARASADHAARQLDDQLLAPIRAQLTDRPLVVVPTGVLNTMPWSVLPTCHGRPVTVAPSATVWLRSASADDQPQGPPVLAAGPRLPAAPAEVEALDTPDATVFVGADATVDAVTQAIDGARLAHIAAHGRYRADNPLFSALELADGPLTVYDLERLGRPPGCMVLSACDSGLSAVRPGDELMGLTAALLGLGTRALVATVAPVPTEVTTPLMVALHRNLRAGATPAVALAAAQRAYLEDGGDLVYAACAGFVCFGAG